MEKTEIEEKNKKRLENTSKSTITHTNKAVSSKKTEHAAKNVLASKTKTNISNVNKGYEDRRINKTTTETIYVIPKNNFFIKLLLCKYTITFFKKCQISLNFE